MKKGLTVLITTSAFTLTSSSTTVMSHSYVLCQVWKCRTRVPTGVCFKQWLQWLGVCQVERDSNAAGPFTSNNVRGGTEGKRHQTSSRLQLQWRWYWNGMQNWFMLADFCIILASSWWSLNLIILFQEPVKSWKMIWILQSCGKVYESDTDGFGILSRHNIVHIT